MVVATAVFKEAVPGATPAILLLLAAAAAAAAAAASPQKAAVPLRALLLLRARGLDPAATAQEAAPTLDQLQDDLQEK